MLYGLSFEVLRLYQRRLVCLHGSDSREWDKFLSMAGLKRAGSRVRLASCRRIRAAQISRTFNGGFDPISRSLFQGMGPATPVVLS
jgi:hypothetical protein